VALVVVVVALVVPVVAVVVLVLVLASSSMCSGIVGDIIIQRRLYATLVFLQKKEKVEVRNSFFLWSRGWKVVLSALGRGGCNESGGTCADDMGVCVCQRSRNVWVLTCCNIVPSVR